MKIRIFLAIFLIGCGSAAAQETQMESGLFYIPKGDAAAGREAFQRHGCVACHRVSGDRDLPTPISPTPGPTLYFGPAVPSGTIAQAIIAPSHTIAPDYGQGDPEDPQVSPMHDFTDKMTLRELRDITAYLQQRTAQ